MTSQTRQQTFFFHFRRGTKRLFDFVIATIGMILLFPLFIVLYACVKLEDGGPAFFSQERVGYEGRLFRILKFRSMRIDAEENGPQLSTERDEDDPRLTKTGRFLRAHHLDELPQLWNVFVGDMSFVGPRPERRYFIEQIMQHDSRYELLYQIRPGVTSYATLYNGYTDTMEKMLRRLELDLYYLDHWSLIFDVKIIVLTASKLLMGKKF